MPVFSTNWRSIRPVILRLAPAPITSTGALASSIVFTAIRTAFSSADGRRATLAAIGAASVGSSAISSGSSRCTAPGFSSSASR